ncbi:YybH family protein [Gloeobacter kilaueensis]|uniref:DUF4440 domain-containing protein n=1 Tax=Gloeobacter kilaueensis (strain ATCC BAA-2537 / CCAP 1431/1 / ULC 316 / JS1) TaxID=1183438 RepID=U5QQV1_GLOK1|nr:DUF4440 domain-containing protein [Gloeobacter kilaueensis]AGY60019.1 hypothetical protein GKIL_3773 [Gloeobacter kilaueensis JS1]
MLRRRLFIGASLTLVLTRAKNAHALEADGDAEARTQITGLLNRYTNLIVARDYEAVAALFAPDGEILNPGSDPVRGKKVIAGFLSGFARYEILVYDIHPSELVVHGNTALQSGSYFQHVRDPDGKLIEASGQFEASWERNDSGQWQIRQMRTHS